MHSLRESTAAQGVPKKDTWTTNVTYAASRGYRPSREMVTVVPMSAAGGGGITTAKDGSTLKTKVGCLLQLA